MARPVLTYLSEEETLLLHGAALEVLADTGVRVTTPEARELLLEAGASLHDEDTIRIPGELVERSLASAPSTFSIFDRNGTERLRLGSGTPYAGAGVTALYYEDPASGERREYTLADIGTSARVVDALGSIDLMSTPGVVKPSGDLRIELMNQREFLEMVTNTTKPLMVLVADGPSQEDIFEMASLIAGGREALAARPFVFPYLNTVSPLLLNPETCDKLLIAADWGMPVVCQAAPQLGATSPVPVAGSVVISAAESLAALVISQLRRPGTPFISGVVPFVMDMRTANVWVGGPEAIAWQSAFADLSRHWGLPMVGIGAGGTDAKAIDEQLGLESAYYTTNAFLSRVDLTFDTGSLECGLGWSPVAAVIGDEVVRMVRSYTEGIRIDDETLSLDPIREVGPAENFLAHPQTLAGFRDIWTPSILDTETRSQWEALGSPSLADRARTKTLEIISEHTVEALDLQIVQAMEQVIDRRAESLPPEED